MSGHLSGLETFAWSTARMYCSASVASSGFDESGNRGLLSCLYMYVVAVDRRVAIAGERLSKQG